MSAGRGPVHEIALPAYRVTVRRGALATVADVARRAAPAHRYAIITDDTVGRLYAPRVAADFDPREVVTLAVPAGEASKTRAWWGDLTDRMLAAGLGRDSAVIALGGGVVGDLAGFVAATFMRGIPYVQVPTTLLAMIDSSIGGKTGVDTPAGKNLVGAFHQPAAVVVDPATLGTLPLEQRRAGLAEAIKHGVIADAAYFETLRMSAAPLLAPDAAAGEAMESLIARSIEIKADVVTRDEREGGVRKTLNFGHTIGHAVETLSGYTLLHGEAVAIGMIAESVLAERVGVAQPGTADRVREAVEGMGLPARRPRAVGAEQVLALTRADKKARAGTAEYALPSRIGSMAAAERGWGVRVPDATVLEVLEALG